MFMYFCCRDVDYLNAKGFIQDPNTVVATLASGQQVYCFVLVLCCKCLQSKTRM